MNGTRGGRNRPRHHQVVRTTISLNPKVHDAALELVRKQGFNGLSDFVDFQVRTHSGLNAAIQSPTVAAK